MFISPYTTTLHSCPFHKSMRQYGNKTTQMWIGKQTSIKKEGGGGGGSWQQYSVLVAFFLSVPSWHTLRTWNKRCCISSSSTTEYPYPKIFQNWNILILSAFPSNIHVYPFSHPFYMILCRFHLYFGYIYSSSLALSQLRASWKLKKGKECITR